MDNLSKEQRSYTMSRIRSKWTAQEKTIHSYLKGNKIKHKMHPKIKGSPDILLNETNTAVFLQGCFWHKCPKCFIMPRTNKKYWIKKMIINKKRDMKNQKILKSKKYTVIKVWEHQIKNQFDNVLERLYKYGTR